jgi:hypothetical protein
MYYHISETGIQWFTELQLCFKELRDSNAKLRTLGTATSVKILFSRNYFLSIHFSIIHLFKGLYSDVY